MQRRQTRLRIGFGLVALAAVLALVAFMTMFASNSGTTTTVSADSSSTYPATAGDDVIRSLGKFRILVHPAFEGSFTGCPASIWDAPRLTSPLMSDPVTKIGHSAAHLDGSAADTGGTAVGTAGTVISDASFSLVPAGFEGPAGRREVHTEIRTLNLKAGPVAVRAGTAAPGRPISPGEVEAQGGGSDFPADSFFNVFVDVDIPPCGGFAGGTVFNTSPLLIVHTPITKLPPKVIYKHDNSSAVPVYLKPSGALFGWLVLAGHGAGFDAATPSDVSLFNQAFDSWEEMPVIKPGTDGNLSGIFDREFTNPSFTVTLYHCISRTDHD
ncbi:MAG: hypothetical protein IIC90_12560, partial [Chloroflexi bacterium]|nr:hypothetical protein [Chloroflexota bacterium]